MKIFVIISILLLQTALFWACSRERKGKNEMLIFVGTYTEADTQGIEIYRLNGRSGALEFVTTVAGIQNPSFLRFSSDHTYLYAVNEVQQSAGQPTGTVSAFAVNPHNGYLTFINRVSSLGRAPCYLTLSKDNRFVLINNYLDGTALSLQVMKNGGLGRPVSILHFSGSGPVKDRQNASHVHSINLDPQNKLAIVADLGTDRLTVFPFNSADGRLRESGRQSVQCAAGAGPRHLVFSADGQRVYVADELNNTVEAYHLDRSRRLLYKFQTIGTLPADFKGVNYPADIHLSPDERFLYVSNRGHESIALFSVDKKSGNLKFLSTIPVYGSWPRNFVLSKDGRYLMVANQKSRNIVTFRRDARSGLLDRLSSVNTVSAPVCVQIFKPFPVE